jgi:hypothetical protein
MDRRTIILDQSATLSTSGARLRRVGHLARRRMRIDAASLRNGAHTDGTLTVEIRGLGSPVAGVPDSFEWEADRPIALVIVRSGVDGEDVTFQVGPSRFGSARGTGVSDGSGIRYVAFCYDAIPSASIALVPAPASRVLAPRPLPAAVADRPRVAAARALARTGHARPSILSLVLSDTSIRRAIA